MPRKSVGFTLVEVLVALTIIAVISAVAIPNLRQFGADEELKNASASVLNTLKLAQSSTLARTKCSPTEGSKGWKVLFNANSYSLIAECETTADKTVRTNSYKTDTQANSNIVISYSSSACTTTPVYVIFRGGTITYMCSGGSELPVTVSSPVVITLSAQGSTSKTVTITKGGVLSVN